MYLYTIAVMHYNDVIMGAITTQITSLAIVYSIVYSDADQRKHLSSASLAFVRGIHREPVISPHKWPVTRKIFPFDDVIMVIHTSRAFVSCTKRIIFFTELMYVAIIIDWFQYQRIIALITICTVKLIINIPRTFIYYHVREQMLSPAIYK